LAFILANIQFIPEMNKNLHSN